MLIRVKNKPRNPNHPLHGGLLTRRQLIGQGLLAGGATLLTGGFLSLFSNPRAAYAALANDLSPLTNACGISNGAGKIPFICFDLAGGGNIAGSNVLVGKAGGQMDLLGTAGYSKLGIPGDQVPGSYAHDHEQRRPYGHVARPRVPQRQRLSARHVDPHEHRHARERQRRRDSGAVRERH